MVLQIQVSSGILVPAKCFEEQLVRVPLSPPGDSSAVKLPVLPKHVKSTLSCFTIGLSTTLQSKIVQSVRVAITRDCFWTSILAFWTTNFQPIPLVSVEFDSRNPLLAVASYLMLYNFVQFDHSSSLSFMYESWCNQHF